MTFDEAWRKEPWEQLSHREQQTIERGRGEAGWLFGWNPYDYADQLAHLGEIVTEMRRCERDPERLQQYAVPDSDDPAFRDGTYWLTELYEQLDRDAFELAYLETAPGAITRQQLLAAEAEYAAYQQSQS